MVDYTYRLINNNIPFIQSGGVMKIGNVALPHEWVLFVSAVIEDFETVLDIMIDLFRKRNDELAIEIPGNSDELIGLLNGNAGFEKLGKVFCITVSRGADIGAIAEEVVLTTNGIRGIDIPTAEKLSSNVYAGMDRPQVKPIKKIWPFKHISPIDKKRKTNIPPRNIKIRKLIRDGIKGRTFIGTYPTGFFSRERVFVKEGKKNMFLDNAGRDVCARLAFEADVLQVLHSKASVPKVVDTFMENERFYLLLEQINGLSFDVVIRNTLKNTTWCYLSHKDQLYILELIAGIIDNIKRIHEAGYAHRDISPVNFIVEYTGGIKVIDFELAVNVLEGYPNPANSGYTPGYTAPDRYDIGDYSEDIFSLGALVFFSLVGIHPMIIDALNHAELYQRALHLSNDREIATLISSCCNQDRNERPGIAEVAIQLSTILKKYKSNANIPQSSEVKIPISSKDLAQQCRNFYESKLNLEENGRWFGLVETGDLMSSSFRHEFVLYPWLTIGVSGPLLLAYRLARSGEMIINRESVVYNSNLEYMVNGVDRWTNKYPGFYEGTAGVGLCLADGLACGLLDDMRSLVVPAMKKCYSFLPTNYSFATGLSGMGYSLIFSLNAINDPSYNSLLQQILDAVLAIQDEHGRLTIFSKDEANDVVFSMDNGIAGILTFLLAYYAVYKDEKVRLSIDSILSYYTPIFIKKVLSKKRQFDRDQINTLGRELGFVLALLMYKKECADPQYDDLLNEILTKIPDHIILNDYGLRGMSGLGHLYLEAATVLGDKVWKHRASWIAATLLSLSSFKVDYRFWKTAFIVDTTMGLMNGSTGVYSFLMRYNCSKDESRQGRCAIF
ncbi:lanthionine synthetase LanC family protein [Chitinophaga sp. Cy-1792]|uniref:protein kinase domain-containing protein n=1 Tax=Chitinophaga sp. Cy-1792 TaxID=2608339 RepID=UPI0014239BA2|nr:lanthionine synthetase LanC family protein [Chitinophaga sp. Cy-1792]NIG57502.1 protein kinase [Chitinophaga sp. Cy-1792]